MSLTRTVLILSGGLAVLVVVVALRAESTRVHFELDQLDRRAAVLWQQVREEELELARLRSPAVIRARVLELRGRAAGTSTAWSQADSP